MEHSPNLKANSRSASKIQPNFMEHEGSLPYLQERVTGLCLEPVEPNRTIESSFSYY